MSPGASVFLWINGLAGRFAPLDYLMRVIASDYFMIVLMCAIMLVMWFGTSDLKTRERDQKAIICAAIGLGLSNVWVNLINNVYFWPRPFDAGHAVNLIFYRPPDPSFPSNTAAVTFAIATAVFMANRRMGGVFYIMAATMGFSRVFVGVHYPVDILGGAALGSATSFVAFKLFHWSEPLPSCLVWLGRRLYLM
ncbi:MAG: phosphatase PAP2 family protein [Dehalococcoidia bacterium]|nr:phosphatase PAP2 family protein [Dehalococcoidia bacterium]